MHRYWSPEMSSDTKHMLSRAKSDHSLLLSANSANMCCTHLKRLLAVFRAVFTISDVVILMAEAPIDVRNFT